MNLNSRKSLIGRLRRGRAARKQFTESNLNKTIAHQIRATRDKLGWSQERLAAEVGMNQNAISRLESPDYGKATLTTLKRLAASMDVGLIVRFVPFSEMVDWVTGTPRTIHGLTSNALAVPDFDTEEQDGVLDQQWSTGESLKVHSLAEAAGFLELKSQSSEIHQTPVGSGEFNTALTNGNFALQPFPAPQSMPTLHVMPPRLFKEGGTPLGGITVRA